MIKVIKLTTSLLHLYNVICFGAYLHLRQTFTILRD